jgi:hypothetical protein
MSTSKLTVLLTNDDGPPGPHSPYIYGLYRHLSQNLGKYYGRRFKLILILILTLIAQVGT